MFDISELEELFKSEALIKNKAMVRALLRNAEMLHKPESTEEQKAQAIQNIKAINASYQQKQLPKDKKVKAPKVQEPIQPSEAQTVQKPTITSSTPAPIESTVQPVQPVPPKMTYKYSPIYQHYDISEDAWNKAKPDAHQSLFNFHNEVMSGKHPEFGHVKQFVEQQRAAQMKKSLDHLYNLFQELKKTYHT